jgi:hypothetical protein
MKRKYQVRWYEYNLTNERSRKFFTEWGAVLFAYYIGKRQNAKARISGI